MMMNATSSATGTGRENHHLFGLDVFISFVERLLEPREADAYSRLFHVGLQADVRASQSKFAVSVVGQAVQGCDDLGNSLTDAWPRCGA